MISSNRFSFLQKGSLDGSQKTKCNEIQTNMIFDFSETKIQLNSFLISQFSYCVLDWMLHSRSNTDRMKYLHERCLRLTSCDKSSPYGQFLKEDGSVYIYRKNI